MNTQATAVVKSLRQAHASALSGEPSALLASRGKAPLPWRLAFQAELHAMGPKFAAPTLDELSSVAVGPESAEPMTLAAFRMARLALLRADAASHRALEQVARKHAPGDSTAVLWQSCLSGYQRLLDGRPDPDVAGDIERDAARAGLAALVVEAAALVAFCALELGDLERARVEARRAARMARTEGLPQPAYMANHVLARVRRHTGNPHLTLRILNGLAKAVPPCWLGWNAWEQLLAEGPLNENADFVPLRHLAVAVAAARSGETQALHEALGAVASTTRSLFPWGQDAVAASFALGLPTERPPADWVEWAQGNNEIAPRGILGLGPRTETTPVYVALAPNTSARRLLALGAKMRGTIVATKRPGRLVTAIAVLGLAGPGGLDIETFFESVYGFKFVPSLHRGALDMLLHRVRELVGDLGEIRRDEDRLLLQPSAPMVVPDPRVAETLDDRLLSVLAHRGGASAREVAKALGVPLRTAHLALKTLVEDGSCEPHKDGRRIRYIVEDTTFQEPTRPGVILE